jgi:hypothetical protein
MKLDKNFKPLNLAGMQKLEPLAFKKAGIVLSSTTGLPVKSATAVATKTATTVVKGIKAPEPFNLIAKGKVTNSSITNVLSGIPGSVIQAQALTEFISTKKVGSVFGGKSNFTGSGFNKNINSYRDYKVTLGNASDGSKPIFWGDPRVESFKGAGFTKSGWNTVIVAADRGFGGFSLINAEKLNLIVKEAIKRRKLSAWTRSAVGERGWSLSHLARELSSTVGRDAKQFFTWAHEMGHQIHYHAGTPKIPAGVKRITQNAATSDNEWFAEHFAAWLVDREALFSLDPVAARFIDDVVDAASKKSRFGT